MSLLSAEQLGGRRVPEMLASQIRPSVTINGIPHHLGLMRVTAAPATVSLGTEYSLEVIDTSIALARSLAVVPVVVKAGANVASWVRARAAEAAPRLRVAIDDSGETFRTDLHWDAGTPWLEILNAALTAAGYRRLHMTSSGVLRAPLWVPPAERAVAIHMEADAHDSIVLLGYEVDTDYLAIPNRCTVSARGSGSADPVQGTWSDVSPTSPWSFGSRGNEWVDIRIDGADVTSEAAAVQRARQELIDAQQAAVTLTFECPWLPLRPGDVIGFSDETNNITPALYEIQSASFNAEVDARMTITARKVVDL